MSDPDFASAVAFSEKAARKVGELVLRQGRTDPLLRVYIEGGGCSGFQYGFNFEDAAGEDDVVIEREGSKLLVDPDELPVPDGLGDRLQGRPARVAVRDQQPERGDHLRLRDVLLDLRRAATAGAVAWRFRCAESRVPRPAPRSAAGCPSRSEASGDRWRGRLAIPLRGIAGASTSVAGGRETVLLHAGGSAKAGSCGAGPARHRIHGPDPVDMCKGFDPASSR